MLGDCAGDKLTLEFVIRYWSCNLIKIPSLQSTVVESYGNLGELDFKDL